MSFLFYNFSAWVGRYLVFVPTVRLKMLRANVPEGEGPYILACTHLGHLDPFILSTVIRRHPVHWLARAEFWERRWAAWTMKRLHAIKVRRFGVAASAIREAIRRLNNGCVVGICPEGGVVGGAESMLYGGPMKKGVCLLSYRTGVPVLPCVVLGTDRLNRVRPWLPFKRAHLWIAFGPRLIHPQPGYTCRRAAREAMAGELAREYLTMFEELKTAFAMTESQLPAKN